MANPKENPKQNTDLDTRFALRLVDYGAKAHRIRPKDKKPGDKRQHTEKDLYLSQAWVGSGSLLFYPSVSANRAETPATAQPSSPPAPSKAARRMIWPLDALASAIGAHMARRRKRRVELELSQMPDYLLRDIGLHRGQLPGLRNIPSDYDH